MRRGRTDYDVTMWQLQNEGQGVCNRADRRFYI